MEPVKAFKPSIFEYQLSCSGLEFQKGTLRDAGSNTHTVMEARWVVLSLSVYPTSLSVC